MSFIVLARPFLRLRVLASGIVAKEPFAWLKGATAFIRRALSALFSRLDSLANSHVVNHGTQEVRIHLTQLTPEAMKPELHPRASSLLYATVAHPSHRQ